MTAGKKANNQTTICDALQASVPGKASFACAQFAGFLSRLTVKDHCVIQAMKPAFENLKRVHEPSGAVALPHDLSIPIFKKGRGLLLSYFLYIICLFLTAIISFLFEKEKNGFKPRLSNSTCVNG